MPDFYHHVLNSCKLYFGQGAKRFVDRQIVYHLSKTPETLAYPDKEELIKWIRISTSRAPGAEKATEFVRKIMEIHES